MVDLAHAPFWVVLAGAFLVLTPLTHPGARRIALAVTNIGLLVALLRLSVLPVLALLVGVWAISHVVAKARGSTRVLALIGVGATLLFLFVVNKAPAVSAYAGLQHLNPILAAVGFSYVALRAVELLRASFERRYPSPDLASVINYLVPFHMLAAGPIQSYDDFVGQPAVPVPPSARVVLDGVERIALGLFKKFVLAAALEGLFLTGFRAHGAYFALEAQIFYLWLFLDFSALSDIAIGVGRLLGVATPENFDRPYRARNLINFWERWHISLSTFIRRNVFIPLQLALMRGTGARRPLLCASAAFGVAFLLVGLWHGITVNFFAWGAIHAFGLIVVNLYRHALSRTLGSSGMRAYMMNPWIERAGVVLTFEYVAFSLVAVGFQWESLRP